MCAQTKCLPDVFAATSNNPTCRKTFSITFMLMVTTMTLGATFSAAAGPCDPHWFAQTGSCVVAPTNPTWASTNNSVTLSWRLDQLADEPNLTRIYRGDTLLKEFPVNAFESRNDPKALDHFNDLFSYTEGALLPNVSYAYKLCSVYAYADECGEPITATTKAGPSR